MESAKEQPPKKHVRLRTYFLAGLGFLLPIWIAYLFVKALFFLISGSAAPFLRVLVRLFWSGPYVGILVRIASFVLTVIFITASGYIVSKILGHAFVRRVDLLFARIPLIAEIYGAVKKLTEMVTGSESIEKKFHRVVLVEYPREGIYSMGLVTAEEFKRASNIVGQDLVMVFVPTPPNPINGLLILVPRSKIMPLDMRVDEAVRMIFSIGFAAN